MTDEDVGAGTGATARDMGEEGTPLDLETYPGIGADELTDDRSQWAAVEGETVTEEGASAGELRDEGVREEDA